MSSDKCENPTQISKDIFVACSFLLLLYSVWQMNAVNAVVNIWQAGPMPLMQRNTDSIVIECSWKI